MLFMGYEIKEANEEWQARGFKWWVQVSKIDARSEGDCPHFVALNAAKGFVREELLNERPTYRRPSGGS